MDEKLFCYHCRSHHPLAEMTRVLSKGVKRWRCRKSIALSRGSSAQRDAFGQSISERNRASCSRLTRKSLPRPLLELFYDQSATRRETA